MDAVSNAIARENMKQGGTFSPRSCDINNNGNLKCDDKEITVDIDKEKPNGGSIAFNKGKVISTNLFYGDNKIVLDDKNGNLIYVEAVSPICTAIAPVDKSVYNFSSGSFETQTVGVQATNELPYSYGAVYSCELGENIQKTFYVLKDDGINVKLIMEENLVDSVNTFEIAEQTLNLETKEWINIRALKGKIELPIAQDLADAMLDSEWLSNSMSYKIGPAWINVALNRYSSPYGYWTSTSNSDDYEYNWYMYYSGMLRSELKTSGEYGVRPVIVVPKDSLSLS